MPVTEYPEFADRPEFVGLFVGGCVERGDGSSFRAQAHAHNQPGDEHQGWVCVRSPRRLYTAAGTPSQVMLHELAHLLTPGQGHTDAWRAMARSLGYRVRAHEEKRLRPAARRGR